MQKLKWFSRDHIDNYFSRDISPIIITEKFWVAASILPILFKCKLGYEV